MGYYGQGQKNFYLKKNKPTAFHSNRTTVKKLQQDIFSFRGHNNQTLLTLIPANEYEISLQLSSRILRLTQQQVPLNSLKD